MYVFLTRVTGIPYTEQQALRSRGDAYRRYQETTNVFFPFSPAKTTEEQPT
jgi:steroid 5-alpha reductase family enzyme